jgi:hypothetical protein
VIGGFHSPLERSVLRLLMEAGGSAVVVLARPVSGASLDIAWHGAIDAGRMADGPGLRHIGDADELG